LISLVRFIELIQNNTNMDVTCKFRASRHLHGIHTDTHTLFLGALGKVSIWSTAEPCLGIVAACLPTLGPLFSRVKTVVSSSRRKEDSYMLRPSNYGRMDESTSSKPRMVMRTEEEVYSG
jgi:hypothetical protein